jgi:penicillin-binding protein 1C
MKAANAKRAATPQRAFLRIRRYMKYCGGATIAAGAWVYFGPMPDRVTTPVTVTVQVFTDRSGQPLDGMVAAQNLSGSDGVGNGPSLAARAGRLSAATIAAEDQRFRRHPGVDPIAIGRAFLADIRARSIVEGGSTLTQQLVKIRHSANTASISPHSESPSESSVESPSESTSMSKPAQAVYAVRLDRKLSKDQLLSAYLAEAPYGGRVIGAEAASMRYFGITASELSWAQAAYLAALPQRPTAFNPLRKANAALNRRNWILRRLQESGAITEAEQKASTSEPVVLTSTANPYLARHYIDLLKARPELRGIRTVRTTLDIDLQGDVEGIARRNQTELRSKDAANVAIVVLDNATGAIRAWEGSGNYFAKDTGGMIDGPLVPRQTGSTIKPFIYALAFEDGMSPGDLVEDTPLRMSSGTGAFLPQNYDKKYRGLITGRVALGSSINIPAVKLLRTIGVAPLQTELSAHSIKLAQKAEGYGLSLALGTAEVSLLDMTRAYASFARGGRALNAIYVEPAKRQSRGTQVVSEATAFLVTDVLADNEARATSFGRNSVLKFPFPVAAKTGTSQDFHDNWVIGYTKDFTVGVWVGNFDRTPLKGATGVSGAGPIFQSVMMAAHDRLTPNSVQRTGDRRDHIGWEDSGLANSSPGVALLGSAQKDLKRSRYCSNAACTTTHEDWSSQSGSNTSGVSNSREDIESPEDRYVELRLVEPSPGATYVVDPTRPRAIQQLPLIASGVRGEPLFTVNGLTSEPLWPLVAGTHKACVVDSTTPAVPICHNFTVTG